MSITPKFTKVNKIEPCQENHCTCGCSLENVKGAAVETGQVADIPLTSYEVVGYERIVKICPNCSKSVSGKFPQHVVAPVQYGPSIQALDTCLNT